MHEAETVQEVIDRLALPSALGAALPRGLRFCYGRENNTLDGVFLEWPRVFERLGGVGARLVEAGVAAGDRVIVHCHDQQIALLTMLACMHIGAIPVAVAPLTGGIAERLIDQFFGIVAVAAPSLIVTDKDFIPEHSAGRGKLPRVEVIGSVPAGRSCPRLRDAAADDICFVQFTSGSTSAPKGVVVTHRMLLDNLRAIHQRTGWGESDGLVGWLPIYHDMSLVGLYLMAVFQRGRACFFPTTRFGRSPDLWMQLMADECASMTAGPNFSLAMINRHAERRPPSGIDLSCVRGIICGSEPITAAVVRRFHDIHAAVGMRDCVMPAYGMAECTLLATACGPAESLVTLTVDRAALEQQRLVKAPTTSSESIELVGCGPACGSITVAICDSAERLLGDDTVGEILLAGVSVLTRYYGDDAPRALHALAGRQWLRTGDLGFTHSGQLYICGRAKDVIIHNGVNYFPADVEHALVDRLSFVRLAAVVDLRLALTDEFVGVGVLFEDNGRGAEQSETEAQVAEFVKQYTSLPVAISLGLRTEHIPRTTSGKLVRPEIRQRLRRGY
jgi:fatty-acyl-CoA synthase